MKRLLAGAAPFAALLLGGCSSAWRTPDRPAVALPERYAEAVPASAGAPTADEAWWRIFADPQLDALEAQALAANTDLAAAQAKLDAARADRDSAAAASRPDVAFAPGVSHTRNSQTSGSAIELSGDALPADGITVRPREYATSYFAPLTATYEADVFGRLRAARRAADATAAATACDLRAVRLSLTVQVASTWYQLVAIAAQSRLAERAENDAVETLALQRARVAHELAADASLDPLAQDAADAATLAAQLRSELARRRHALSVLCNLDTALLPAVSAEAMLPAVPAIPAGVPSELLRRRPDIAAADARLDVALARIGGAKAAFFPQITLTGSLGFQSEQLGDLLRSDSLTGSLLPQLSLPLFAGGRNLAQLKAAQAEFAAAAAAYEGQVRTALREVDDALSDRRELAAQTDAARAAWIAAERTARLAAQRVRHGLADRSALLAASEAALARQRALVAQQGAAVDNTLALILALGGSWSSEPALASAP